MVEQILKSQEILHQPTIARLIWLSLWIRVAVIANHSKSHPWLFHRNEALVPSLGHNLGTVAKVARFQTRHIAAICTTSTQPIETRKSLPKVNPQPCNYSYIQIQIFGFTHEFFFRPWERYYSLRGSQYSLILPEMKEALFQSPWF